MILPSRYVELRNSCGICLDQINVGSDEVAFPTGVALEALGLLKETSIAVLGGDVLRFVDDNLEYAYANSYCKILEEEESKSYAQRSRHEAVAYVEKFVGVGGFEPLFVFVLSQTA